MLLIRLLNSEKSKKKETAKSWQTDSLQYMPSTLPENKRHDIHLSKRFLISTCKISGILI